MKTSLKEELWIFLPLFKDISSKFSFSGHTTSPQDAIEDQFQVKFLVQSQ